MDYVPLFAASEMAWFDKLGGDRMISAMSNYQSAAAFFFFFFTDLRRVPVAIAR